MGKKKAKDTGRLEKAVGVAAAGIGLASVAREALRQRRRKDDDGSAPALGAAAPAPDGLEKARRQRPVVGQGAEAGPSDPVQSAISAALVGNDGAQPSKGDGPPPPPASTFQAGTGTGDSDRASAPRPQGSPGLGRLAGAADTALDAAQVALVVLNSASPVLLRSLRKINKKRMRRILAHRPFGRVKDLRKILPKRVYKAVKHQLTA